MICPNYHLYLRELYQVSNLFENLDKTDNLKFRPLVIFFNSGEESREEENRLN